MEHVLHIGVSVDDDAIKQAATDCAAKAITKDIEALMFRLDYMNRPVDFKESFGHLVSEAVENHKDEIIKMAADSVAESLKRSKKYKALLAAMDAALDGE